MIRMSPDPDIDIAPAAAVVILFTTPPTDRALTGWCPDDWITDELRDLEILERIA
jgi:hypothetical protein